MNRRAFIAGLGGTVTWPTIARATQETKTLPRIGFLFVGSQSNSHDQALVAAFRQGLADVGLVENRDVLLDLVWVGDNPNRAVAEVIQRGAEVLVPCGSTVSVAAKRQTSTLPIVFISVGNPIAMGLVDGLSHPGSNATGFSDILADLSGKLVEVATELGNSPTTIDYFWYTAWPDGQNRYEATEQAARAAGVKLRARGISDIAELDGTFAEIKRAGAMAVIIQPSPFVYQHRGELIASAMKHRLGTIWSLSVLAREGGLIAYGPDDLYMYRRAPFYVKEILKGAKPADLPVELPTKVHMAINLKTAKALGLNLPPALLARADEVIE